MSGVLDRAVSDIGAGHPVVIEDDGGAGFLCFAAELATPELLAFTVRRTSGFVRVALRPVDTRRLELPLMRRDSATLANPYTVAFDASGGVSTGISAADRARTIAIAGSPDSRAEDLSRPGHVVGLCVDDRFPPKGIGFASAALRLVELAGWHPAAAVCELVDCAGDVLRDREVIALCERESLTHARAATVLGIGAKCVRPAPSWPVDGRVPA